ncbi:MAG: hypothetical protein PHQ60_16260 [Sideroxydans sp.]|nr:hypothetical protein [Sideroxydans sp.]
MYADKQAFEGLVEEYKLIKSRLSKMEKELKIYRVDYLILNEEFMRRKLLCQVNDKYLTKLTGWFDEEHKKGGKNRRAKQQG